MSFRVLHIEDSDMQILLVRKLLEKHLKQEDYMYEACHSLEEAREHMNEGCLDIVLVDLGLPDSNGVDSVTAVRASCPGIPIVVLTGTDDIETAKQAIHAGAAAYVRKTDIAALPLILILTVEKWEMEKQLTDRCHLYDSVVNLSPDYIVRFRPNGVITFANVSFATLVMSKPEDIVGTTICDYISPEAQETFRAAGKTLREVCIIAEGGEFVINDRWVAWRLSAIRDPHGRITEFQCVGRDTTYRHRQTQELLELARNRMSEQQQKLDDKVDVAFATLVETDRLLSQMESGGS